jgi:hypothetical protein
MNSNPAIQPFGRVTAVQWSVLLLTAVALRAGVLCRFGDNLALDRDDYRRIAGHLAAGDGFVHPAALSPTAYRPPLYPLLLAAILAVGGGNMAIGIVQLGLGTATVALTVLGGCRLGVGRASLAAGLLVAIDPLLLHQTALVMTETLATFLAALLLWLSLDPRGPIRNVLLGIVFGFCSLCRPTFWAFGILATAFWVFTLLRPRNSSTIRGTPPIWGEALCLVAGVALVVAPWGIRNARVFGRPIITTTHGGYTLLLAHNPAYTRAVVEQPWGAVWEGAAFDDWLEALETELAREVPPIDEKHLSPAVELARDQWMNRRAWDYLRREPRVALKSGLTLLGRFWNAMPMATQNAPLSWPLRMAIGAYYIVLFGALVVGICRTVRGDWQRWHPLLRLIVAFTLVHALYWADMRMRTPLVPAIALLACQALSRASVSGPPPPGNTHSSQHE